MVWNEVQAAPNDFRTVPDWLQTNQNWAKLSNHFPPFNLVLLTSLDWRHGRVGLGKRVDLEGMQGSGRSCGATRSSVGSFFATGFSYTILVSGGGAWVGGGEKGWGWR